MRSLAAACGIFVAITSYAQDLPEWVLQLSRAKRQAKSYFEKIPNYACQEIVRRMSRRPGSPYYEPLGGLYLEVAVVGSKEILTRKGESTFEDVELGALADSGLIGTGTFASTARNLFVHDNARVTAHGEEPWNGQPALWFDFELPSLVSGAVIKTQSGSATVGLRGRFYVDAATYTLLSIRSQSIDIPTELGIDDASTVIHYAKVKIGAAEALLPEFAEMITTSPGGAQNRNLIRFSGCREFLSESTIRFDDPSDAPANAATPPPPPPKKK